MKRGGIVLVLSGFPRRSETFALQEVLALARRGALSAIVATKPGDGQTPHPDALPLLDRVCYLPEDNSSAQAKALTCLLQGRAVSAIHAYFAHEPTEVAMLAAEYLRVPFGFSVHARDARKVAPAELGRRAQAAQCVVACNPDVALDLAAYHANLHLIPHGVDTIRFQPTPFLPAAPIRLLAVGRFVPKKGFDVLIRAAARFNFPFVLRIVGDGPEEEKLRALIVMYGVADRVELCPSMTHAELPAEYAAAHIVIVPSVVDASGDRDGLPNVLLEAMACGRPVVASAVGAVASAVIPGVQGLLTPGGDAHALANAVNRLAAAPGLRLMLGGNARQRIEQEFDLRRCTERFCTFLETTYGC